MDSGGGEGVQGQAGQHIKDNYNKNYSFKNILKINQGGMKNVFNKKNICKKRKYGK